MAIYTRTLIIVNTPQEAEDINAGLERNGMYYEEYAIHYACMATGFRYEELDNRYTGDRRSLEWERYIASCRRQDLRRGFDN